MSNKPSGNEEYPQHSGAWLWVVIIGTLATLCCVTSAIIYYIYF